MFSRELYEMDKNTELLMVAEFSKNIEELKKTVEEKDNIITENKQALAEKDNIITEKDIIIAELRAQLAMN